MIVTQKTDALCAQLQLQAVDLASGSVIAQALHWELALLDSQNTTEDAELITLEEAKPLFQVHAGRYRLRVQYRGEWLHERIVLLQRQATVDLTVLLGAMRADDPLNSYHVSELDGVDAWMEYKRREMEREGQRSMGVHAHGLRDPERGAVDMDFNDPGMGAMRALGGKKPHPMIAHSVQFQGIGKEETPDPERNLPSNDLKKALMAQAQPDFNPSPTPYAGG